MRLLGKVSDFEEDRIYYKRAGDLEVIIYKKDGIFYCLENRCSHEDFPLEDGEVEEHHGELCIACPAHGAKFRLTDGGAVSLPATEGVTSYKVIVEGEDVWLLES
jgi:3-phenylpropionate/trans-cinnamate dioxygenase ferredoxin subunit